MENTKKTETDAGIQNVLTNDARERLAFLDTECRELSAYENFIDNLDCSAKIKRVLRELARRTADIGGQVVRIGKIALDFAIKTVKEIHARFPHVTCAILVLLVLKVLISSVPFLGWILAALLEPLFIVTLVGIGVGLDLFEQVVAPFALRHFGLSSDRAQ